MEINIAPPFPEFAITSKRAAEIRGRFFPENGTNDDLEKFERSTEAAMAREQPDLWKHLGVFAALTPLPKSFSFGAYMGYATITEKERLRRLTKSELEGMYRGISKRHSIKKDENSGKKKIFIDFKDLEKNLKKNSGDFFSLVKQIQEDLGKKNNEAGVSFYYGVMFALYPFFRRTHFQKLGPLLKGRSSRSRVPLRPK